MHFESCFSLSGSNNPRGQGNVKHVILISFLFFRFCIGLTEFFSGQFIFLLVWIWLCALPHYKDPKLESHNSQIIATL